MNTFEVPFEYKVAEGTKCLRLIGKAIIESKKRDLVPVTFNSFLILYTSGVSDEENKVATMLEFLKESKIDKPIRVCPIMITGQGEGKGGATCPINFHNLGNLLIPNVLCARYLNASSTLALLKDAIAEEFRFETLSPFVYVANDNRLDNKIIDEANKLCCFG